ncbi:glycoside hydrolase family 2 TIM barrel-domain containing protein [Levilactobacillus fujinensis]|uniref:Glycoside hydrolase family 2 TIM barrel-domain containing protein n=1 Tax=Levilactobacillus fujinensis TaxID=2486024 RepID=A0ABW1TGB1_9LACO|nr:glycoside hydrolase family 2 TIM barrel-domain containing protein [Levilactobacillus fujinensis]
MIAKSFNFDWQIVANEQPGIMESSGKNGPKVTLPYDALIGENRIAESPAKDKKGYFPNKQVTLVKKFKVPDSWQELCATLMFEGIYANSKVYINNQYAGGEAAGYTSFSVNLDHFLKYGEENELKVVARAMNDSRWYSGAGIYRDVRLFLGKPVHIPLNKYRITTVSADDEEATVRFDMSVKNVEHMTHKLSVETHLFDGEGNQVVQVSSPLTIFGGNEEKLRQRLMVDSPELWSPNSPKLYQLICYLKENGEVIDQVETPVGIRMLEISHSKGLQINHRTVKLRGACIHHDNGLIGAADIGGAEERRIIKLKSAGFNAIRCAHNQASQALLSACDRHGLLVMDELSDMWDEPKNSDDGATNFSMNWKRMTQSLVESAYNHPSVIIYSIGNEITTLNNPHGAKRARQIGNYLRMLDDTRYLTNATNLLITLNDYLASQAKENDGKSMDINELMTNMDKVVSEVVSSEVTSVSTEEAFDAVDIAGYNYATSRYELDENRFPQRIICGTETYPRQIDDNWALMQKHPYLIGDFTWTGWDYLGEAGLGQLRYEGDQVGAFYGEYPWKAAYCGDFDLLGNRRPVSYYREIVFGLRQKPYIAVRFPWIKKKISTQMWGFIDGISSWTWHGYEDQTITVEVYATGEEVSLSLNDKLLDRQPVKQHRAIFEVPYAVGNLTATSYRQGEVTGETTLTTADEQVQVQAQAERQAIVANDSDLAYVNLELVDRNKVVNGQANCEVKVTVDGPGELVGLGNADPKGEENFTDSTCTFFNGRALAIVRPTGAGEIIVTVHAKGQESQIIQIKSAEA